jgi:hypothetical protein
MQNADPSATSPSDCLQSDSAPRVTPRQAWIDNLPYMAMIALGAAILWISVGSTPWHWALAAGYVVYGVLGAVWIMLFVCPWCHFYDTNFCPCGYGRIAARLRAKKDGDDFARRFRRYIPAIVPLWFLPPIVGAIFLCLSFSWTLLSLLVVFALNSYVILPLVSKHYGCTKCPQKDDCPWMGGCR